MDAKTEIVNPANSKRIQKILDMRVENDKDFLGALSQLSTIVPTNNASNRRNLKSAIEKTFLDNNDQVLNVLRDVQNSVNSVTKVVTEMHNEVVDMTSMLAATKAKTRSLIDQTTYLQKQVSDVETKSEVATALIERFQLKPQEVAALRSSNINSEMLAAMNRTSDIYDRCKLLSQVGFQTLALDIMEQMSFFQETGFENIFRWCQTRCKTIEQPDPSNLLPQAMAKLQSRPAMFQQVLEQYCSYRRDLLVRQLISALTRGGRPIEHRVTEPKRYVGDMLAWLHQAVPAERDNILYLLKFCELSDVGETVQQALSTITEGVCHPLKVRVEHILLGENSVRDPLLLQSLHGLLRYYHDVLFQILGPGQLKCALAELMETAEKTLVVSLTARVALLLGSEVETVPSDLVLAPAAAKVLTLLSQILSVDSPTAEIVAQTVSCVVDPLLVHVTESAARLPPVETAVYLLNCYYAIDSILALYPFLDERLEKLKAQSEAQMDTLTSEQASSLVAHLSLGAIYTALQGTPQKPLSKLSPFEPALITAVESKLRKVIAAPDLYLLPKLGLLSSMGQRLTIQRRAGAVIVSIYTDLFNAIRDPENLFPNPDLILALTPETVAHAFGK